MNTSNITTNDSLARRFAARLHSALDRLGYPALPLDRARTLGQETGIDFSLLSTMLNGLLLPEWNVLLKLCALVQCQPGYFLDDTFTQYPPDVRMVKPIGVGENLILRLPAVGRSNWGDATADWTYLIARQGIGYGILEGDFVVNFSLEKPVVKLNSFYLIGVGKDYEIRQCTDVSNGQAVFLKSSSDTPALLRRIYPLHDGSVLDPQDIEHSGVQHFGEVASVVRGGNLTPGISKPRKSRPVDSNATVVVL